MAAGATSEGVRWITNEELRFGIVLLSLVALLGVRIWSEGERPVTRASLRVSLPRPGKKLRFDPTDQASVSGRLRLQLRALALTRYPPEASDASGSMELLLPVSADTCRRWQRETGHDCAGPTRLREPNFTLTWAQVQAMHFRLRHASWWSMRPSGPHPGGGFPTGWSLESSSSSIKASVNCLVHAEFTLITDEGSLHSRCVPGGRPLRLLVKREPGEDDIAFYGVNKLHLDAEAGRVTSVVSSGTARAGDEQHSVQGRGERVGVVADSGAVEVGADAPPSSPTTLQVDAAAAASVKVGDTEVVPTLFSHYEWLWGGLFIAVVLGLFTTGWGMYKAEPGGSKS